eukprot:1146748-Pelagomonas_calceolata.AAC.3
MSGLMLRVTDIIWMRGPATVAAAAPAAAQLAYLWIPLVVPAVHPAAGSPALLAYLLPLVDSLAQMTTALGADMAAAAPLLPVVDPAPSLDKTDSHGHCAHGNLEPEARVNEITTRVQ